MITDNLLLENGYMPYKDNWDTKDIFFQKRFRNERGQTKYFINIHKCLSYNGYEVNLQFEQERYTMNIILFAIDEKMTLKEIEQEVYAIWYGLDCKYYDNEVQE